MLVTLITYFRGDTNAVRAVLEFTDLSTAVLGVILTFATQIFVALFFTGPRIAADHRFPATIRKGYISVGATAALVSAFLMPAIITIAVIVLTPILLARNTRASVKAVSGSTKPIDEWLADDKIKPDDTVVATLHTEAVGLVKSMANKSRSNPTLPDERRRLSGLQYRIVQRYAEIRQANVLGWPDAIYMTLVATVGSNIILIIALPPPLGPNYQVGFTDGQTKVVRVLDKGKDRILIIDSKSRRPEVVMKSTIKETKLCIQRQGFLWRPLVSGSADTWNLDGARGASNCLGA
jgi:hypothetical protein